MRAELDVVARAVAHQQRLRRLGQAHRLRCPAMVDENPDGFPRTIALTDFDACGNSGDDGFDGTVIQKTIGYLAHESRVEPGADISDAALAYLPGDDGGFAGQPSLVRAVAHEYVGVG